MRFGARAYLVAGAILVQSCAETPTSALRESVVVVDVLTPSTVRTVVLEASGPGIDPAVVLNIDVGADSVARDTLRLTSGSARRLAVTAFDTLGVPTHRADTTVSLVPGASLGIGLVLRPLSTRMGITVTFGNLETPSPR